MDDGSTDGSSEILDEFQREVERRGGGGEWRVIHQGNRGVSASRNAALEAATGDWIGFVDADDCVAHDWFRSAAELIVRNPGVELVRVRDFRLVRGEERMPEALGRETRRGKVAAYRGEAARRWGRRRYARDGWSMLNFVRRDVVGSARFRVGMRIKEDVLFFLELARKVSFAVESDHSGYLYRVHADSALRRFRQVEDGLRFAKEMLALERAEDVRDFSCALGYDLIQWMAERDRSAGYDGEACPLRRLWLEETAAGRIRVAALPLWWRPGVRRWLRTGDLGPLMRTWRLRVKAGEWILRAGRVLLGRRWTRQSI